MKDNMRNERIINLRKNACLSQGALASQLNYSKAYIADIERGRQEPSRRLLAELRNFFGVSIDWLLFGDMAEQEQYSRPNNAFICPQCGAKLTVKAISKFGA